MEPSAKKWGRAEILSLVAVLAVGAGHLLLGLGGYGLWDPPADWKASHKRHPLPGEEKKARRKQKKPYGVPIAEINIAEKARRKAQSAENETAAQTAKKAHQSRNPRAARAQRKRAKKTAQALKEPPLRMKLITWGLETFGVYDWAARLPIALTALAAVVLVFLVGTWSFGWVGGLFSAGVLLGLPGFVMQARLLTSAMVTTSALTLAICGFMLFLFPRQKKWLQGAGLLMSAFGLLAGYLAAGAVLGVLAPTLTALVAMVAWSVSRRQKDPHHAQKDKHTQWAQIGALAVVVIVLAIWTQTELAAAEGYSSFLGTAPRYAAQTLTYAGVKTPPHRPVVFDALARQAAYSAFPWIALVPLALALCASRAASQKSFRQAASTDDARLRFQYGSIWAASWAVVLFLLGTYWVLRFDDLPYLGLPALGLICGAALVALSRADASRRTGAALIGIMLIAIIVRDFIDFPQALAQSQVNYQLQHPEEVGLRGPVVAFGIAFGLAFLVLLISRPHQREVRWPETLNEWLLARHESSQLERLRAWRWLSGPRSLVGWPGAVMTGVVLLVIVWVKLAAYGILEFLLYPLWLVGRAESGARFKIAALLFPGKERRHLAALIDRFKRQPHESGASHAFWIVIGVAVLPLWGLRVAGRTFWLATAGTLAFGARWLGRKAGGVLSRVMRAAPRKTAAEAAAENPTAKKQKKSKKKKAAKKGKKTEAKKGDSDANANPKTLFRYWAAGLVVLLGLAFSYWAGHILLADLSTHFSHKSIFETFKKSRAKLGGKAPLALYKMQSRSATFYNAGNMLSQQTLRQRYPYGQARLDPLVAYLAEPDRVFALIGVSHLGSLDNQARKAGVDYHVLDASSQWFVLVSNKLAAGEKDRNPLKKYISDTPPRRVGRRINAVLKEPGSKSTNGDLVLLGADIPRVIYKGHKFRAHLHFYVKNDLKRDWKIFIHFDGPGPRFFGDHEPLGEKYKTRFWTAGTYVTDPYVVPANHTSRISTPSGVYRIYMGLYRGSTRMTVIQGPKDNSNRINLGTVRVMTKPLLSCSGSKAR